MIILLDVTVNCNPSLLIDIALVTFYRKINNNLKKQCKSYGYGEAMIIDYFIALNNCSVI
jgi:hypothetical protein